jgi:hypothetical protein
MLDFFLVLGQVPGTHFYLTFTEIFSTYSIALITYTLHREYHLGKNFLIYMQLVYVMYSQRLRPGPVRKRAILPDHIDSIPLIDIDVENLIKHLQDLQNRVQLAVERI